MSFVLEPIGHVESPLSDPADAPRQGDEGGPDAWLVIAPAYASAAADIQPGMDLLLLTWLDRARRDVQTVHPRGDLSRPLEGVFTTRSPHRPNPVGLHRVRVLDVDVADGLRIKVGDLEALDGTPLVDIKPVLGTER
jgi:tRNA-Thr(GGU) m(6)t(6)A37 methyltransferase TsaA